jgi:BirA family biotin operon repressor/biotin-[acetyl-CoA-carboxylase] ligase
MMTDGSGRAAVPEGAPPGIRIFGFDAVESTNDEARRLAAGGAASGVWAWARRQEGGRGRRGRQWLSPEGNFHGSLILRPTRCLAECAQLSFVAALAVAEAVETWLPAGCQTAVKWPNDVLVDGAKIAGILLEAELAGNTRVDWLVVGIGINLQHCPDVAAYRTTSIRALGGAEVSPETALESLNQHFTPWYECWQERGFEPIRAAWLVRAMGVGEAIQARCAHETLTGIFVGLDADGALILAETGDRSSCRRIAAGDIFPIRG